MSSTKSMRNAELNLSDRSEERDRAAKRLLETSTKYLEGTLKLKVNQEKSRVVSVRVYARVAELLWGCRYEEENR